MKRIPLITAALAITASHSSALGSLIEFEASNHMGMRWLCRKCDPLPLNGMSINWGDPENNQGFEDRTFLVYDVSSIDDPASIVSATLRIGMQNQDDGGPIGVVDVSTTWLLEDDLPPAAFWWGDFLLDFEANEDRQTYEVDVTQFLRDPHAPFAYFRLSTETLDRYFLGEIVGFPVPTLAVTTPEPSGILFLISAAFLLMLRREPI